MIDVHVSTSRLCDLLGTLAHPHRLLLVSALADGARDAAGLSGTVGIGQLGVTEHLRVLRAHHIVADRREDGRTLYELTWPGLIEWLGSGMAFMEVHQAPVTGRMVELPRVGQAT
jgi:DNA-binding transcriptional ArsR family regulator